MLWAVSPRQEWDGGEESLIAELKQLARSKISGFAVPDRVLVTPGLPKTRSGKIMRRQVNLAHPFQLNILTKIFNILHEFSNIFCKFVD